MNKFLLVSLGLLLVIVMTSGQKPSKGNKLGDDKHTNQRTRMMAKRKKEASLRFSKRKQSSDSSVLHWVEKRLISKYNKMIERAAEGPHKVNLETLRDAILKAHQDYDAAETAMKAASASTSTAPTTASPPPTTTKSTLPAK